MTSSDEVPGLGLPSTFFFFPANVHFGTHVKTKCTERKIKQKFKYILHVPLPEGNTSKALSESS